MNLFSTTISNLERGLDYSMVKQKTIAQNVANADTYGYKAKDVQLLSFNEQLGQAMQAYKTNEKHVAFSTETDRTRSFSIKENKNTSLNNNGNNVDVEREMTEMAENQIYYNALIERLNGKFQSLNTVIRGGK